MDIDEGKTGGAEEIGAAEDDGSGTDDADTEGEGHHEGIPWMSLGSGKCCTGNGDEAGEDEGAEGDVDGTQAAEKKEGLFLDTADVSEPESFVFVGLGFFDFGDDGAEALTGTEETVAGAKCQQGGGIGQHGWGCDERQQGEGIAGKFGDHLLADCGGGDGLRSREAKWKIGDGE